MDEPLWRQHLAIADRHVELAERIVATQRLVLAELQRGGHPTETARRILKSYEDLLQLHIEDRDRIKKDLAEPDRADVRAGTRRKPRVN